MKKHMHGGRPQLLHDRVPMLISFERDRLREFEQQCDEAKMSVSEGIRQLLEQELEKKAEGETNPCNINYISYSNKPLQPVTLDDWMDKIKAITEPEEAGRIEGFHKTVMQAARNQFYELKARRILKR